MTRRQRHQLFASADEEGSAPTRSARIPIWTQTSNAASISRASLAFNIVKRSPELLPEPRATDL